MHCTSVYGLELLVWEGTRGKALAMDHRENLYSNLRKEIFFIKRH